MPRRRISEYRAKVMVHKALNLPYVGWSISEDADIDEVSGYDAYVVKVDQAVKGRFKKGLVILDVKQKAIAKEIASLRDQGYGHFIVEPFVKHNGAEHYLALTHTRQGLTISVSQKGGIDIEQHKDSIATLSLDNVEDVASQIELSVEMISGLVKLFADSYATLLEINPYVVNDGVVSILDAAIEVDDAGMFFTDAWSDEDIRDPRQLKNAPEEDAVKTLARESSSSFNLSVLNPDGSIFLLLSGGGASVVIADEIYNLGFGKELANYGEYSGNPNEHETYLYAQQIFSLMAGSKAPTKKLFIGGAAANFTDIANTFAGIISALDESAEKLRADGVKVYVRRGGPRQKIGLAKIEAALKKHDLYGGVYDTTTSISDAVKTVVKGVKTS